MSKLHRILIGDPTEDDQASFKESVSLDLRPPTGPEWREWFGVHEDGYRAAREGLPASANPFEAGTLEHVGWYGGWMARPRDG